MERFLFEIFIVSILIGLVNSRIVTIVRTNKGRVLGRALLTVQSGKEYIAFKGIPYAKPPTGRRRFKVTFFFVNLLIAVLLAKNFALNKPLATRRGW